MESLKEFLTSFSFAAWGLPVITVAVTVFFKIISRNDRHGTFVKEDFAIGVDLSVTAIFALAVHVGNIARKVAVGVEVSRADKDNLADAPTIFIGLLIGLTMMTFFTRVAGWKSSTDMRVIPGIVVPAIFGFVALTFAARIITQ